MSLGEAVQAFDNVGGHFLVASFGRCHRGLSTWINGVRKTSSNHLLRRKKTFLEKLWRQFFSDPTQWWDHRFEKVNPRYPDFKHKKASYGLWLVDTSNPPWVGAELSAMAPRTLQLSSFSWNQRFERHVTAGEFGKAISLFQQMQEEGIDPDKFTFVRVLKAVAGLGELELGRHIHLQSIQAGYEADLSIGSCLIDMYYKCGSIYDAWQVFSKMPSRNVVTWSTMILGYVKCGQGQKALQLFQQMNVDEVDPTPATFVGVLMACGNILSLEDGKRVHEMIIQKGCESDLYVANGLINMYGKCGSIEDAWRVFNNLSIRDVVVWTSMIQGYVKCGQGQKALELFQEMQLERVDPTPFTYVGVLNACASVMALPEGRDVHKQIIIRGFESDAHVCSSLVDMYAKCGSIVDARQVFSKMQTCDAVSWNAMLGGYAMHGYANEALEHFERMSQAGVQMNGITFLTLLSACSHVGLVDEGLSYFANMGPNISATVGHYGCLVDLLGRAGRLHEAEDLITKNMTCEPTAEVWLCLLGACQIHGNMEVGDRVAKRTLELDPACSAGYVLLSNMYAAAGKWDVSASIKRKRLEMGLQKSPGLTWIKVDNRLHSFTVNDYEHPQMQEIHNELERLSKQIKEAGYVADTKFVMHDVEEAEKVFQLCHHSEKLAIAFGLISTPPGISLQLFKNLRTCGDCHTATKFISKIAERTIIVRDANRFHHFQGGVCSCKDYW